MADKIKPWGNLDQVLKAPGATNSGSVVDLSGYNVKSTGHQDPGGIAMAIRNPLQIGYVMVYPLSFPAIFNNNPRQIETAKLFFDNVLDVSYTVPEGKISVDNKTVGQTNFSISTPGGVDYGNASLTLTFPETVGGQCANWINLHINQIADRNTNVYRGIGHRVFGMYDYDLLIVFIGPSGSHKDIISASCYRYAWPSEEKRTHITKSKGSQTIVNSISVPFEGSYCLGYEELAEEIVKNTGLTKDTFENTPLPKKYQELLAELKATDQISDAFDRSIESKAAKEFFKAA